MTADLLETNRVFAPPADFFITADELRGSELPSVPAAFGRTTASRVYLPEQIDFSEINELVAAPTEHRFQHEQAESLRLFISNRRRH
jgi:hypothetical protein